VSAAGGDERLAGADGETVLLAPREVVPAHRHNADVFAYVLRGSIITQVEGDESQTVHAGEVFYRRQPFH
jgi:quercetin dioxygenase-like cupin family protein